MLDDWFMTIQTLMDKIQIWKVHAAKELEDDFFVACLTASWLNVEKYYKKVDDMPVYYAAIVLNPTLKMQWFKEAWRMDEQQSWILMVEQKVKQLWRQQYKHTTTATRTRPRDTLAAADETAFDRFKSAKRLKTDSSVLSISDELEDYLSVDPQTPSDDFDILAWWQGRKSVYPQLYKMAMDVFSIPLMSDDNERSFSSGRDMITYRRA